MRISRTSSLVLTLLTVGVGAVAANGCTGFAPDQSDCLAWRDCPPDDGGSGADQSVADGGSIDAPIGTDARAESSVDAPQAAETGGDGATCTAPTSLDCNGTCVDPTQPAHCGSCSNVCAGPDGGTGMGVCNAAADGGATCSLQCESPTTLQCGGTCYDPATDAHHCGSCTNDCIASEPSNSTGTCAAGADGGPACGFKCDATYHACNGQCLPDSNDPSMDPCVLTEQFGVFVAPAPMGSDAAGCGTRAAPCATVDHAMDIATASASPHVTRVYACGSAGNYDEHVLVNASRDGLTLFGYLSCPGGGAWAYDATKKATAAPTSVGYALELSGLSTGATFESFAFQTGAASGGGASSIAVFAHAAVGVMLKNCAITAGVGVQGQDQVQPAPFGSAAPTGSPGSLLAGGPETPNLTCPTSTGGAGGPPAGSGNSGSDGTPGPSNKGTVSGCQSSIGGGAGATGGNGNAGGGAANWAAFDGTGWTPAPGQSGSAGAVGQGGGGGASIDNTGGGGAGGAGGCGGAGGGAGTGGGSSIAILAFDSSVDAESCVVTAAAAGRGGNGATGQTGQTGGTHGSQFGNACLGGKGGNGGNGGGGGGGAGGLSAGIVWIGTAPIVNGAATPSATTLSGFTSGTAGLAGLGATVAQNGKAGTAGAVVQFQ